MSPMTREFAVLSVYRSATKTDHVAGVAWYAAARGYAVELSKRYKVTVRCAAGVIAALSPRNKWAVNKANAASILRAVWQGSQIVPAVSTFRNRDKAWRIANGEAPLRVLGGPKVRAFYANIVGDESQVTVDVWAAKVAEPYRVSATVREGREYETLARAYVSVAKRVRSTPAVVQAVCWVAVRGSAA